MYQHALLARRRVMDKPRLLKFNPFFVGEVVEFVGGHFVVSVIASPLGRSNLLVIMTLRGFVAANAPRNTAPAVGAGVTLFYYGTGVFVGGV